MEQLEASTATLAILTHSQLQLPDEAADTYWLLQRWPQALQVWASGEWCVAMSAVASALRHACEGPSCQTRGPRGQYHMLFVHKGVWTDKGRYVR